MKRTSKHPVAAYSSISRQLRNWRNSEKKNVAAVAAELGVSRATWGHWESGTRYPSPRNLELLSQYTGLPMIAFLCPKWETCEMNPAASKTKNYPM